MATWRDDGPNWSWRTNPLISHDGTCLRIWLWQNHYAEVTAGRLIGTGRCEPRTIPGSVKFYGGIRDAIKVVPDLIALLELAEERIKGYLSPDDRERYGLSDRELVVRDTSTDDLVAELRRRGLLVRVRPSKRAAKGG